MTKRYPKRWIFNHGAFYYVVPHHEREHFGGKTWYLLGHTESEAYLEWSKIVNDDRNYRTMTQLIDRYMVEIAPSKATKTYKSNQAQSQKLRAFFGQMSPNAVKPKNIYQYLDIRAKTPVAANREIALLSHIFTKAIRWGVVEINPCTGKKIEKHKETPRDRYVTDDEFAKFFDEYASEFLQTYLRVKYLVGQRKSDVLRIKLSDISKEGIAFQSGKTGKKIIVTITPELSEAIELAKAIKRKVGTLYLFATRTGQPYIKEDGSTSGFNSVWQRRMKQWCDDGNSRFTEHDIRAKTASDTNAEHANQLMQHRSKEFTEKVYRRKTETVVPISRKEHKNG